VAPFKVGLINLKKGDQRCDEACETLYRAFGDEVLYDDRDDRAGVKFAAMDLIGLPWQVIVGPKGIANGQVELKSRKTGERQELPLEAALERFRVK
jgi:prolyl-tRNA synthetase